MSVAHACGGLSNQRIRERLITFKANGVFTIQGAKSSIIVQLINKYASFMIGVHSMAHQSDLDVQIVPNFEVMKHVEDLLATLYFYFSSFLKCTLKFLKLVACLESRDNEILRNVKTRWISMLGLQRGCLRSINRW